MQIEKNISLKNTLSGKKEDFKPIVSGQVTMYNCGPTVYNDAHIGNLRSYIFADVLRRMFEYNGYKVNQVINITDIGHLSSDADDGEDKMTKALKREGKPLTMAAMREVADFYFAKFKSDIESLNIELPTHFPFASDHIAEDVAIVTILSEKGFAYTTSDGIYFDTAKFPEYGKLGGVGKIKIDTEQSRIGANSEKKNPRDFALWKFNSQLGYDSSFGKGFPGWHIECSAMSRKYLGQPFDIHTGGIDHIPVHHNNEIAQSEAAYGMPLANVWMHNAHLNIGSDKMAKSGDNFITLQTLKDKGLDPMTLRYLYLMAHYSTPVNFSWEALLAAETSWKRLKTRIAALTDDDSTHEPDDVQDRFHAYVNDDLDTPKALALVQTLLKDENISPKKKKEMIEKFDTVLGLNLTK